MEAGEETAPCWMALWGPGPGVSRSLPPEPLRAPPSPPLHGTLGLSCGPLQILLTPD